MVITVLYGAVIALVVVPGLVIVIVIVIITTTVLMAFYYYFSDVIMFWWSYVYVHKPVMGGRHAANLYDSKMEGSLKCINQLLISKGSTQVYEAT